LTNLADMAEFARRLREGFEGFRRTESLIREQYTRDVAAATTPAGELPNELLERPTRRFLIDDFLRALDWDPDVPSVVAEEARAATARGDRLFFDYLGIAPHTRSPVVLVEAKSYDLSMVRRPREAELEPRAIAALIAAALDALKGGADTLPVISEWGEWLRDLRDYIVSLGDLGQSTLRRVVITAGRWIIVFREPVPTFTRSTPVVAEHIHCFPTPDDILSRHAELFELLHRARLVDTLPLTLRVSEALEMVRPATIADCFRGVVVATTTSGGARRRYPTRAVYPTLIVSTGGRLFGITDYDNPAIEEPLDGENFSAFVANLEQRGTRLEQRLRERFGLPDLRPSPIETFPGFRTLGERIDPVVGSTADQLYSMDDARRSLVVSTGELGAPAEYLVVCGLPWFYKGHMPTGPTCPFHTRQAARRAGAGAEQPHSGPGETSFTQDGQERHCAHEELRGTRRQRCHVRPIETHMCCRACVFYPDCWATDANRLPCP
jgi:hypothetical protein